MSWKDEVVGIAMGSCKSAYAIRHELRMGNKVTDKDVTEALLDFNYERCKGCGWWEESCMLDGGEEEGELGYHDECQPKRDRNLST